MHGRIYDDITQTMGNTPLVRLQRVASPDAAEVVVKLESFNPLSSVKDRISVSMVEEAERTGELKPGSTIVEATSGNTGIGIAFVAAAKGYKCVLVMMDTMSLERRKLLQALGAELVLTKGPLGIPEAQRVAAEIAAKTQGAWLSKQFDNAANPKVHRETTAQEILRDTGGEFDAVVAGVGTGGTITGCGQVFKKVKPAVLTVAVLPVESAAVLQGGPYQPHRIQGIGPSFIPANYDAGWSIGSSRSPSSRVWKRRDDWRKRKASSSASPPARSLMPRWRSPVSWERASASWRSCRTPASAISPRRSSNTPTS
jgi:cysteine synthase A